MAKVEILKSLEEEINKKFKVESIEVFKFLKSIETSPRKGKVLGQVGGILIKELKYKSFRFYFLVDGFKLKFLDKESLEDLLFRFVRMSDKRHQQKVINEIREVLLKLGPDLE